MTDTVNRSHEPPRLDWKSWDEFPPPKLPIGIPVVMLIVLALGGLLVYRSYTAIADALSRDQTPDALGFLLPILGMLLGLSTLLICYGMWKLRNWGRMTAMALLIFGMVLYTVQFLIDKYTMGLLFMLIPIAGIIYLLLPPVVQEYDKAEVT